MTIKDIISLFQYGTDFEVKGAYSGRIYYNSRRHKQNTLKKYYDLEVVENPIYSKLAVDKDTEYCRPIIGIWVHDYDLCNKTKKDDNPLCN